MQLYGDAHDISDLQALRRDVRGLAALEVAHHVIALAVLVAVAIQGVLLSREWETKGALGAATGLALLHLALAFRLRVGGELVRRDLRTAEVMGNSHAAHPYRASATPLSVLVQRARPGVVLARYIAFAIVFATAGILIESALFH